MSNMPPYKFVKNQNSTSKIGYLSKDVKVINDLIDDLSKFQVSGNDNDKTDIMTNPLEIDDKESTQSISSSTSRHSDGAQKSVAETAKLKDQVLTLGPHEVVGPEYKLQAPPRYVFS